MRRVVYLDHTAELSGGELALLRVLPFVDGEATVILAQDGPLVSKLRTAGLRVEVLPMDPDTAALSRHVATLSRVPWRAAWSAVVHTMRLRRRLLELQPDVVHTNSLKSALYGGVAARLAGLPVVWHVRDRIAPDYLPGGTVRLVRLLSRVMPTAVIANSRTTMDTLPRSRRRAGRDAVIPSAVTVQPKPRRVLASGNSALAIGIVGRLAPWKGQDVFLRAFAAAFADTLVEAHVIGSALFGEEAYAASLAALAAELRISHQVRFRGFVDDMSSEYARLDILVHASVIPEPFGQVVVEGMAAGVPVIASAAGGPLEVITDGVDGILSKPASVEALSQAMLRLAGDVAGRQRLSEAGLITAARYGPDAVGRSISQVHSASISQHARSGARARVRRLRRSDEHVAQGQAGRAALASLRAHGPLAISETRRHSRPRDRHPRDK